MSSFGTFGSFTQARLGIYAAQKGMSVTGNNIANINTPGYTRQRLEQKSFYAGSADRYYSSTDQRVGYGVLCEGVSQLRDPYLDIRYRTKTADVGSAGQKLDKLMELQSVLDEVGKGLDSDGKKGFGVLEAQFSEIYKQLQQMIDQTGDNSSDIQVRSAAETLVKQFRAYAAQLEELRNNAEGEFTQDIDSVNRILNSIRDLNESIRGSEIHGDQALELRDERNMLIDQLSEYMKIDVRYTTEDLGGGRTIEKLIISLGNANPDTAVHSDETVLIDGIYGTQLSVQEFPEINKGFDPNRPNDAQNPQYIDKNGNPTHKLEDAKMVKDPHLRLEVSELKSREGQLHYTSDVGKRQEIQYAEYAQNTNSVHTDNDTGVVTITSYTMVNTYRPLVNRDTAKYGPGKYLMPVKNTGPNADRLPYMGPNGATANIYEANLVGTDDQKEAMNEVHFYKQVTVKTPSYVQALDDNDLYGSLQSLREFLTEEGEFTDRTVVDTIDENALTKRGVGFYKKSLDLLARQFAEQFNEANHGFLKNEKGEFLNGDGQVVQANDYQPPQRYRYDKVSKQLIKDDNGDYYKLDPPVNGEDKISIADHEKNVQSILELKRDDKGELIECDKNGDPAPNGGHYVGMDGKVITKAEYDEKIAKTKVEKNTDPTATQDLKGLNSYTADQKAYLLDKGVKPMGMNLFSTRNDVNTADGITASNISISKSWSEGTGLVISYVQPSQTGEIGSTDSSNLLHMLTLLTKKYDFDPSMISPGASSTPMFNGSFQEMLTKTSAVLGGDIKSTSELLRSSEQIALDIDMQRYSVSSVDLNDEAMNLMQYSKSYNAACRLMTTLDSMLDKLINGTGMTT